MLHETARTVLDKWQLRKKRKDKDAFIAFVQEHIPEARAERSKSFGSTNIVVGDVDRAKVVFTAHYDTQALLPLPNLIFPESLGLSLGYSLVWFVPLIVLWGIMVALGWYRLDLLFLGYVVAIFFMMMGPIANKHTANDNTSGTVTLLELWDRMTPEQRDVCALVWFDNEENGLLGSMGFKGLHKAAMKDKLLINFDCISDGTELRLAAARKALETYGETLRAAVPAEAAAAAGKTFEVVSAEKFFYPSDQMNFEMGVGATAQLKTAKGRLYLDKIHTSKDTVFDEEDIELFLAFALNLTETMAGPDFAAAGDGAESPVAAKKRTLKKVLAVAGLLVACLLLGVALGLIMAALF